MKTFEKWLRSDVHAASIYDCKVTAKHLLAVAEEWLQQEAPGSGGGCNVIHGTPHELCEYLKSYIKGKQEA